MSANLNRKVQEAEARRQRTHRRAATISAAVMFPLVVLAYWAVAAAGFYFRPSFWILCTVVVGGVLYAVVSSLIDPDD